MAETKTYGTTVVPSDTVTTQSGGTVDISLSFNATVGYIGNMDTANGNATPGNKYEVASATEARDLFGADSELARHVELAYLQGVENVICVPVKETQITESFASTSSGTLSNAGVFDPNVMVEHDITAQDTTAGASVTVNITYGTGTPSTPSNSNTINLNPENREWAADASSSYDITYSYGDYTSAAQTLAKSDARFTTALSENVSIVNDTLTEVNTRAQDFDFKRAVAGIMPEANASSYSDNISDQRMVLVGASRAYTDSAETEMVRTTGVVAAKLASKPLGDSATYEQLDGLTSLHTKYTNSDCGDLIDAGVLPVKEDSEIEIVKDMTTSSDAKFERVYACEIVDDATAYSHEINKQYIGELNTADNREMVEDSHVQVYKDMATDRPPLLDDYAVSVSQPSSNDNEVDVNIGLDVVDVIDTIDVTLTVGDVVRNGGAA